MFCPVLLGSSTVLYNQYIVSRLNPCMDEVSQASHREVLRDPVTDRKGNSQKGEDKGRCLKARKE